MEGAIEGGIDVMGGIDECGLFRMLEWTVVPSISGDTKYCPEEVWGVEEILGRESSEERTACLDDLRLMEESGVDCWGTKLVD